MTLPILRTSTALLSLPFLARLRRNIFWFDPPSMPPSKNPDPITTIAIAGTGLTGLWAAYRIRRDLAHFPDKKFRLIVVGKGDWQKEVEKASKKALSIFSHETSGFEPIGIQPHSGLLWNTDNEVVELVRKGINKPDAAFYTAPDLGKEGREFLDLYTGWHARHPDQQNDQGSSFQRQESLIKINRYARKLWDEFQAENGFNAQNNPLDINLKGAWRIMTTLPVSPM